MIKQLLSIFGYLGVFAKVTVFLYLFYLFIPVELFIKKAHNRCNYINQDVLVKKEDFLSLAIIVTIVQFLLWQIPATTH